MNCKSVQVRLSAYVDRELTGTEMLAVRAHLSVCELCRIEEEGLREIKQILTATPIPEPPADFADRLVAAMRAEVQPEPVRPRFRLSNLGYVGIAAFSMAATYMVITLVQPRPTPNSATARKDQSSGVAFEVQRDQAMMVGTDATGGVPIISASNYGAH